MQRCKNDNMQLSAAKETSSNVCFLCLIVRAVQSVYSQSQCSVIFTVVKWTLSPPWCYLYWITLTSPNYSYVDSMSAVALLKYLVALYTMQL